MNAFLTMKKKKNYSKRHLNQFFSKKANRTQDKILVIHGQSKRVLPQLKFRPSQNLSNKNQKNMRLKLMKVFQQDAVQTISK